MRRPGLRDRAAMRVAGSARWSMSGDRGVDVGEIFGWIDKHLVGWACRFGLFDRAFDWLRKNEDDLVDWLIKKSRDDAVVLSLDRMLDGAIEDMQRMVRIRCETGKWTSPF